MNNITSVCKMIWYHLELFIWTTQTPAKYSAIKIVFDVCVYAL